MSRVHESSGDRPTRACPQVVVTLIEFEGAAICRFAVVFGWIWRRFP